MVWWYVPFEIAQVAVVSLRTVHICERTPVEKTEFLLVFLAEIIHHKIKRGVRKTYYLLCAVSRVKDERMPVKGFSFSPLYLVDKRNITVRDKSL